MDTPHNGPALERDSSVSLPLVLNVAVLTPCVGQQNVDKVNDGAYSGAVGDFTIVNLYAVQDGGQDSWAIQVVNFNASPTGCYGFTDYRRSTPSADPIGTYCLWDGSVSDCSAGQAVVS